MLFFVKYQFIKLTVTLQLGHLGFNDGTILKSSLLAMGTGTLNYGENYLEHPIRLSLLRWESY